MVDDGLDACVPEIPVEQVLGDLTRRILPNPTLSRASILQRKRKNSTTRIANLPRLAPPRLLTIAQYEALRAIVEDPRSYFHGRPIYKRLPSIFDFLVEIGAEGSQLDLLIDLHNPGWEFRCGNEIYWKSFNFAGHRLREFAKTVFPEYASTNSKAVWRAAAFTKSAADGT